MVPPWREFHGVGKAHKEIFWTGSTGYKSEVGGQSHGPATGTAGKPATGTAGKHTQSENAKPVSRRGAENAEKWDTDQHSAA